MPRRKRKHRLVPAAAAETSTAAREPAHAKQPIPVNARRMIGFAVVFCVVFEIFLVLTDAFINYGRATELGMVRRFFNITREDALATWFSVTQIWMVALTAWLIFVVVRNRPGSRVVRTGWLVLAIFFSYMSMDDGSEFHERMGSAYKKIYADDAALMKPETLGGTLLKAYPSYPWQILFLPFFGAMGLFMLYFLWREFRGKRSILLIAAAVGLFILAVFFDFFEEMDDDHPYNLHTRIQERYEWSDYDVSHFSKSFEEFFEMLGMTLIWAALLQHLVQLSPDLHLRFHSPGKTS